MSPHLLPKLPGHHPVSADAGMQDNLDTWLSRGGAQASPQPCPAGTRSVNRLWSWQSQAPPPAGDEAGTPGCWEQCARPHSWYSRPNTRGICPLEQTPRSGREGAWVPLGHLRSLQSQEGMARALQSQPSACPLSNTFFNFRSWLSKSL